MSTQYDPEEYSQIMREFAGYKLVIQGRSPRTVNEYMLDLRTFFRFLIAKRQGNVPEPHSEEFMSIDVRRVDLEFLRSITTTDIYDFLFYTDRERGNKSAARARTRFSAIAVSPRCTKLPLKTAVTVPSRRAALSKKQCPVCRGLNSAIIPTFAKISLLFKKNLKNLFI